MSFALYTDSSANLTEAELNAHQIEVVSLTVSLNGVEILCYEPGVVFDHDAFFRRMREESTLEMKTSMVNTATFLAAFEPHLQAGRDILYISISGGISGTCGCSQTAAEILRPKFPERDIMIVDSLSAVAGEGMLALEAAHLASSGAMSRAFEAISRAELLADTLGDPYTRGIVEMARGAIHYFEERWPDALRRAIEAVEAQAAAPAGPTTNDGSMP